MLKNISKIVEVNKPSSDPWFLGTRQMNSRLIIGTGGLTNLGMLTNILDHTDIELTTVSMRRFQGILNSDHAPSNDNPTIFDILQKHNVAPLPNTAGSLTASEAILTAELSREALETNLIKLEVVGDHKHMLPEPLELVSAAEKLVELGFNVLAYTNDDPMLARRLAGLGCVAVMPGGSPIGTGLGILNPHNIAMICESVAIPVILDAGIGAASDAALAMELGCSAVLLATAVTRSDDPIRMSQAMSLAVQAGRQSYLAGRIPKRSLTQASSSIPDFF